MLLCFENNYHKRLAEHIFYKINRMYWMKKVSRPQRYNKNVPQCSAAVPAAGSPRRLRDPRSLRTKILQIFYCR